MYRENNIPYISIFSSANPGTKGLADQAFRLFMENTGELVQNLYSEEHDFPTVILLDLNMAGILSLQALKEIRADKKFSHIPIIVLTTSTLCIDKRSSNDLGANCFLRKPDFYGELTNICNSTVRLWLLEK